ncbi:MAG: DegV family protein [Thermoflexaceae bacterium]|nr:DegV family protein [Thermoflexaceae bacterium]
MNNISEKIAVITDSCADVPKELVEKYNIFVLPMIIHCNEGELRDGIDVTAYDIYEKLKTELPRTSTPSGADVLKTFEEIKKQGYTKAVAFILSGGLSGSYNQIRIMAEDEEELEVAVYDSRQGSIGTGAQAVLLSEYLKNPVTFEEAKKKAESLIENTKVFFAIDTLEYLVKGGRIGKAAGFAGSILDLKPILSFDASDGEIYAASKVRGHKKVESKLISLVKEETAKRPGKKYVLLVADGDLHEERDLLEEKLKRECPDFTDCIQARIGGALSTHLGRGLLGAGIVFVD